MTRSEKYKINIDSLPTIPSKRYFTIGEVSKLCQIKPYVLRYWEAEFPSLKPIKRQGNRRYYQYEDILLVRKIIKLLYQDAYTIEGARTKLTETNHSPQPQIKDQVTEKNIKEVIKRLEGILQTL